MSMNARAYHGGSALDHKIDRTFPFRLDVGGTITTGRGRHALDAIACWAASQGRDAYVKCTGRGLTLCNAIVTFDDDAEGVEVFARLIGPDEIEPRTSGAAA